MIIKQVDNTIEVKQVGIKEIFPYAKNPRKNDTAVDALAKSIEEFGFCQPISVDKDMIIITGHTRWKAAKKLKLKTVPVQVIDWLTDNQVKAYRLVDNKVGELAEWDIALLNDELVGLEDFEMGGFGFEDIISPDGFGTDFELPSGDKEPFQQMTFTLSDEQAEEIKAVLADAKKSDGYDCLAEAYGNENSNGNALYLVVSQWAGRKI